MKLFYVLFLIPFLCQSQVNFVNRSLDMNMQVTTGDSQYGSGVSFQDFDNDGLDDITFGTETGQPIMFYKNMGNTFALQNLNIPLNTSQVKQINWVDIDNDGDKDLFVTSNILGNKLYLNTGSLNFTDITTISGLPTANITTYGASWGDYNNDGNLDVFLSSRDPSHINPNKLYRNNGNNTFTDVSNLTGISENSVLSFCSAFFDYNNDGFQDIYISNDRVNYPNILYRNNGDNTFTDVSSASGTGIAIDAMSTTIGDYDSDGYLDIYVTNTPNGNVFLKNNGNGTFTNVASATGTTFNSIGWSAVFLDAENDTDLDLYVSGSLNGSNPSFLSAAFYLNNGSNTFSLPTNCGFLGDTMESFSNAIGDFNNDGLSDIVVNNANNNDILLWKNESTTTNNYLKVNLQGTISNRDGIGSKIEISIGGNKQYRYTLNGEGYLAQNSSNEIFGLGTATQVDYIKVTWLSGLVDTYTNIAANQTVTIVENTNILSTKTPKFNSISVFPNPVQNYLTINGLEAESEIAIISILGQELYRIKSDNNTNTKVDVSLLDKGVYIITITGANSNNTETFKFIKN
jgi:hypothetical protein